MLLERVSVPLPRVLERMGCLQAQYAPSIYIGLWSRVEGLGRDAVTTALERKKVVQGTLMRSTIHLVSAADYWPLAVAVREARREQWARTRKNHSPKAVAAAARRLQSRFREGPLSRAELSEALDKDPVMVNAVGLWLDLVRVPPSGTWERRRADLYAAAGDWLGEPGAIDHDEALDHTVRRYLGGFGPATLAEIADWAGLPPKHVAPALERIRLRRFVSEDGDELVDVPRAPLPDPDAPAPPRFLPTWDATMLVHARRAGVLPEELRPRVFSIRNPHSVPTFLVDGVVAGAWRFAGGAIRLEPWRRLDRADERALADEAERLAAFHA